MKTALTSMAITLAAAMAAGEARAQATNPPAGCTGFLTVQTRACTVSHYWRCEAAPEGTVWEVSHDLDGPVSQHVYDREFQWVDAFYFNTGTSERLFEAGPDPISMSELLEKGVDTYDFTTIEQTGDEAVKLNTKGRDEATGKTEVIDGVTLHTFTVNSETRDENGDLVFAATGKQYVLKEERLFMLGQESYFDGEEQWQEDNTPREFIFPGEKGFTDFRPRYGCNALQAGLVLPDSQ
ncbi:MAG: hypothetical protein JXQ91_07260 [Vannielia sp.]|uniref:hypothetical protein n=1 Tax=Rhodobacterales TaxID=204455 RepID=UPI002094DF4C|nr:hypothetical protein [Oceanicola sp. 502str15]MCO6384267.1 hypothetical protein [Oceanicola sp. 502str15]